MASSSIVLLLLVMSLAISPLPTLGAPQARQRDQRFQQEADAALLSMEAQSAGELNIAETLSTVKRHSAAGSYVIAVAHQATGGQPYPRGVNSKAISLAVGRGSSAVNYSFTIDTGSGILMMSCKTQFANTNCGGSMSSTTNYVPTLQAFVSTPGACSANGVGCLMNDGSCFVAEPLTGGSDFNIYKGRWVQDTVTFNGVQGGRSLQLNAQFACAEAYIKCDQDSTTTPCYQQATECPAKAGAANEGQPISTLLGGACPGSNHGIEAGWTLNAGGVASAAALPQQVFQAGLISGRVTGFCYQQPPKDSNCAASVQTPPNSFVVLGSSVPRAVGSFASLSSAPLIQAVFPKFSNLSANPYTHTLRTVAVSASVPTWSRRGGHHASAPWLATFSGNSTSVLWDSGAYAQSIVPQSVYEAFLSYFTSGLQSAQSQAAARGWTIQACQDVAKVCGSNYPTTPSACQQVSFSRTHPPSAATLTAAKQLLASIYPASIDITLQGGAVAQLPTAFTLNLCSGSSSNPTTTSGVAVCSSVRPPTVASQSYFWVAGPWFSGRFVQFDASTRAPGYPDSTGVIRFSNTISSCAF